MATSNINGQHIGMTVYLEGGSILGVGSVTPPEVKFLEMELNTIGGKAKVPMRKLDTMEATLKLNIPDPVAAAKLINPISATRISVRGQFQTFDPATGQALSTADRIDLSVIGLSAMLGERKNNEAAEREHKMSVLSVGYFVDSVEILYADTLNAICRINGVDVFAGDRTALGIS